MEKINEEKAAYLYDFLDNSSFYKSPVAKADRSIMNVVFRTPSEELDAAFVKEAKENGLTELKGHRARRRLPREHLQCDADRRRQGAGRIHEEVRAGQQVIFGHGWQKPGCFAAGLLCVALRDCPGGRGECERRCDHQVSA